ncbi:MAG: signal peptidase II [Gemmatimonadales bacterium]|nr:signal peptidase II [Gemmatimonadales bacterium]
MGRRFFPVWVWVPLVLVIDFVSKRIVLANEEVLRAKIEIIGDLLRFAYVRNPGSAMGLFPLGRTVLVSVSILASLFLIYLFLTTDPKLRLRRAAMAAILGGALGNLVDRIFYGGFVVDFIDVGIGTHRFYTFNVADMGVSVGGALLFLCLLVEGFRDRGNSTEGSVERADDPAELIQPIQPIEEADPNE